MSDLDILLDGAKRLEGFDDPSLRHLTSPLSLRDYARIADQTTAGVPGVRVLDWGCGYGQISYLLARRGFVVTSYDVGGALADRRVPFTRHLRAVRGERAYRLPFRSSAFDAVVACGVLEHVSDADRSLEEIHRVLVSGGRFLVFNLPQRSSYKELVVRSLRLGYAHDRRYTSDTIRALLRRHGFEVVTVRRAGMLPHLATGLPVAARRVYDRSSPKLFTLDRALSRTPVLNLLAQSLEVVAETRGDSKPGPPWRQQSIRSGRRSPGR